MSETTFQLAYGKGKHEVSIPDDRLLGILQHPGR